MARGWESKSVEEQQSEFNKPSKTSEPVSQGKRHQMLSLQTLLMKRAHVVEQLRQAQNSRFIELMQSELAYLDREIAKLKASGE